MKSILLILAVSLSASLAKAADTLIVSDIDDTLKISQVRDTLGKIGSAFETDRTFIGMSQMLAVLQGPATQMVYLSAAPDWLMRSSHTELLRKGGFPQGLLILRNGERKEVYKLEKIRQLISQTNPRSVFLFGDDGEIDGAVYEQVIKENPTRQVIAWIHNIYQTPVAAFKYSNVLRPYVTPVEISYDLLSLNLVNTTAVGQIQKFVLSALPTDDDREKSGPQVIPSWARCPVVPKFLRPQMQPQLIKSLTEKCSK
jgi:Uncharacterized conserved protein (DUF2183)